MPKLARIVGSKAIAGDDRPVFLRWPHCTPSGLPRPNDAGVNIATRFVGNKDIGGDVRPVYLRADCSTIVRGTQSLGRLVGHKEIAPHGDRPVYVMTCCDTVGDNQDDEEENGNNPVIDCISEECVPAPLLMYFVDVFFRYQGTDPYTFWSTICIDSYQTEFLPNPPQPGFPCPQILYVAFTNITPPNCTAFIAQNGLLPSAGITIPCFTTDFGLLYFQNPCSTQFIMYLASYGGGWDSGILPGWTIPRAIEGPWLYSGNGCAEQVQFMVIIRATL